jgi:excisionase family DNA binding protein
MTEISQNRGGEQSGGLDGGDLNPAASRPDIQTGRQFLSVEEYSHATGLSNCTVRRLIRDRKIPSYQPGGPGARVLIPLSALDCPDPAGPSDEAAAGARVAKPERNRLSGPRPRWLQTQDLTPDTPAR